MNLQADDFELFGVAKQFAQDRKELDERWKSLQREAHPDKFAAQGAAAQRIAMQWSVRINEAYQRLKDPLKRAAYLCELGGASVNAHSNTSMPTQFLMQQMEWREALDEDDSAQAMEALLQTVRQYRSTLLHECQVLIDERRDMTSAVDTVRALMFIEKFAADIEQRLDLTE